MCYSKRTSKHGKTASRPSNKKRLTFRKVRQSVFAKYTTDEILFPLTIAFVLFTVLYVCIWGTR